MSRLIDAGALAEELWRIRWNLQMMDDTQTADKMMTGLRKAEIKLENAPTIDPVKWIPVKFRPMDSEEREYWEEQFGEELADEDAVMFDCPMPEDGQEILVSYRRRVDMDKCEIDGGCYGLEGNGDWEDVTAWMPLPEPWRGEE